MSSGCGEGRVASVGTKAANNLRAKRMSARFFGLALILLATRAEAQEMWSCAYQNYETPPRAVDALLQIERENIAICVPPSGGAHFGSCRVYRIVENNEVGIVGVDSVAWDKRGGAGVMLFNRTSGELVMSNTFLNRDSSRTTGKCEKK